MTHALFAYGTLMYPPVMRRLAGRVLGRGTATLDGFARHALRGASYPGIVPDARASVTGVAFTGVWPALLARLDRWEGDAYVRVPVHIALAGGAAAAPAFTYVLAPGQRSRVLPEDWDAALFERRHLALWSRRAGRFASGQIDR